MSTEFNHPFSVKNLLKSLEDKDTESDTIRTEDHQPSEKHIGDNIAPLNLLLPNTSYYHSSHSIGSTSPPESTASSPSPHSLPPYSPTHRYHPHLYQHHIQQIP